jgi:hypothetical protein
MALSQSNASNEGRSFSVGPIKAQLIDITVASGDTSGSVTCDRLARVDWCIVSGLTLTAAPTFADNIITLAFVNPAATRMGQVIALGR